MRVREYYGYALIAGISHEEAEDMLLGYILDMYIMRLRYDAKLAGAKLAGRAPDKKHPMGHGRTEYLSAAIISIIVLYAGVTAFVESVKKIIHPETPDYSKLSLLIIAVAVVVKILLGLYV